MNRNDTSDDAIKELRTTGKIEVLPHEIDIRTYELIKLRSKTLDELIRNLKREGFSEFIIGACVYMESRKSGKGKFRNIWSIIIDKLTPSILKKT